MPVGCGGGILGRQSAFVNRSGVIWQVAHAPDALNAARVMCQDRQNTSMFAAAAPHPGGIDVMTKYLALASIACALLTVMPAMAQQTSAGDYPKAPIKIVVSVPAGGGVDSVTRLVADKLQQRLG